MSYENAWNSNDMLKWKSMNWWLLFLNAKLVWKSLWDFMNIIQRILQSKCLSFFIGWTWLLSYGYLTRKNRIGCKSRSCHVSLIMLDIVAHDLKSINLYILAFLMTNGEIGLNSFRNLCHLLCQIPLYFGLECYMSCLQSMVIHTFSIK